MYLAGFAYVFDDPAWVLAATVLFVVVSQVKINLTNAYAGSLAWSNFFARLTHSHPGRVVWLVFNVLIAVLLMTLGVFEALEQRAGPVQQRRDRLGRRAGGRPGDQQAAGLEPEAHRVQARAPVRHQPGRPGRDADRRGAGGGGLHRRAGRRRRRPSRPSSRCSPSMALSPLLAWWTRGPLLPRAASAARCGSPAQIGALLGLRERLRVRGHGAVPGLRRADLLAVLHARVALPRPLQDRLARGRAGARGAGRGAAAARWRARQFPRRALPRRRGVADRAAGA